MTSPTASTGMPRTAQAAADCLLVGLAFELSLTGGLCDMTPSQRLEAAAACTGFDTFPGALATLMANEKPLDPETRRQLHLFVFQTRQRAFEAKLIHAAASA